MAATLFTPFEDALAGAQDLARALTGRERVRLAVTGLSRAGKTVFLTSLVANLLAAGRGARTLPALEAAAGGRLKAVRLLPGTSLPTPLFDAAGHLRALAADPPRWPERTDDVSSLELELELEPRSRLGQARALFGGRRRVTLELLDYPGEWLLDLPMLAEPYAAWSAATLGRLRRGRRAEAARGFLAFVDALPPEPPADGGLIREGFSLYRAALLACRDRLGFRFLQPGRALNPGPGAEPSRLRYFPLPPHVAGGLAQAMARRHETYQQEQRERFFDPFFRRFHRQVVLVDALGALHAGEEVFDDTAEALGAVAASLRGGLGLMDLITGQGVRRVGFAATKADHVPSRSRDALHGLLRDLVGQGGAGALDATTSVHAVASIRCTEDDVATLEGRPVTVVRGVLLDSGRSARIYPGEVPLRRPDGDFWQHAFFEMPVFQPPRLEGDGSAGIPHLGLDALLAALIGDLL